MVKLVVCDDDELIVDCICNIIERCFKDNVVIEKHYSTFTLLDFYIDNQKKDLDVLIMDVELRGENGIQIASSIIRLHPHVKVIIISGFLKYAEDVFDANPVQFLIKPVNEEKLIRAVEKSIQAIDLESSISIKIVQKQGILKICTKDIKYFESSGRCVYIHERGASRKIYYKLDDLEKVMPCNFLRCHKSFIVNMNYVKEFRKDVIILNSGDDIPISRSKYASAKIEFLNYLGDKL
jgi:DNA-binding LytR/AlgR family response regulator